LDVGVLVQDLRRLDFGYFVRPGEETLTGKPRVEPCLGYVVKMPNGLLIFDTGMGEHPEVDAHYRPSRRPLRQALHDVGAGLDDVRWLANCHLHFDHCGGNPELAGRPVFTQRVELSAARTVVDYTIPALVDYQGVRYEEIAGETDILPGVLVIPTPGHTDGHQSLVIRCDDGTVIVLAGQAHDTATEFGADVLAARARRQVGPGLLPEYRPWVDRLTDLDPARILFAHDQSVWEPT
jgi:N-acyl homoserine lactone hydrolase